MMDSDPFYDATWDQADAQDAANTEDPPLPFLQQRDETGVSVGHCLNPWANAAGSGEFGAQLYNRNEFAWEHVQQHFYNPCNPSYYPNPPSFLEDGNPVVVKAHPYFQHMVLVCIGSVAHHEIVWNDC